MAIKSDRWIRKMGRARNDQSFNDRQVPKRGFLWRFLVRIRLPRGDEFKLFTNVNSALSTPRISMSGLCECSSCVRSDPATLFALRGSVEYSKSARFLTICVGKSTYARWASL